MAHGLTLFATAFGLGLVFNAAPGPVFAETLRHGVRGGFRPALQVQLGSLVGDATWALLGLAGAGLALQLGAWRVPLGLAGAAYLLWLSWDSWKASRQDAVIAVDLTSTAGSRAFRSGALLSLTNPQNLAYWAAIGSALGALGLGEPTPLDHAVYFSGFMAASLAWCFVCAAIVDRVFRGIGAVWARTTYRLCAAALLALAVSSLRDLWRDAALTPPAPLRAPAASAALPP